MKMRTPKQRVAARVQKILDLIDEMLSIDVVLEKKETAKIETAVQTKLQDALNKLEHNRPRNTFSLEDNT